VKEQAIVTFIESLREEGLTTRPEWIVPYELEADLLSGLTLQNVWKQWRYFPDGLISDDDNATTGFLKAANALEIALPEQLRIASHANMGSSLLEDAPVIRMGYDIEAAAEIMVHMLQQLLESEQLDPSHVDLYPRLF
jgi:DNA-binding LacI/PurR family transcriptional regulator